MKTSLIFCTVCIFLLIGLLTINLQSENQSNSSIYSVINVIPSPVSSTRDLAFDGTHLWIGGRDAFQLYKLSPIDGSIIKTIPTSVSRPYGLTFDGSHLWVADNGNHVIHKVDTSNGNVLQTIPTPAYTPESYPYGLAWDGSNLWHNDTKGPISPIPGDSTFKINTSGSIIAGYKAYGGYPTGLAFDGQYLWSSDNELDVIYKINVTSFTAVDTINAPGGDYPNGLTWDGQYLWVANNDADSIYQVDVGGTFIINNNSLPAEFSLSQNYPNPFNPSTTIKFTISPKGQADLGFTILKVYNVLGKEVATLVNQKLNQGTYELIFNAGNIPSGVYFYQLRAGDYVETRKMLLVK